MDEMINSQIISVTPKAKAIAQDICHPSLLITPEPIMKLINAVTLEMLPEKIKRGYGLGFGRTDQLTARGVLKLIRTALPFSPQFIRLMPQAPT